jgi:hypothetical protein
MRAIRRGVRSHLANKGTTKAEDLVMIEPGGQACACSQWYYIVNSVISVDALNEFGVNVWDWVVQMRSHSRL